MVAGASCAAWAATFTDNMVPNVLTHQCTQSGPTAAGSDCQTDNGSITVWMESSLEAVDKDAVRSSLDGSYQPINNIEIIYASSPVTTGGGETDIMYQEDSAQIPSSLDGMTWCDDAVDTSTVACDQHYVRIRGNGAYTRGLVCHETGHAIGLLHGDLSVPAVSNVDSRLGCMTTPVQSDFLGENNVTHIHETY